MRYPKGAKSDMVVDDLRLAAYHAMADHGSCDFLHIRNALTIDLKDALKDFADGRLMC